MIYHDIPCGSMRKISEAIRRSDLIERRAAHLAATVVPEVFLGIWGHHKRNAVIAELASINSLWLGNRTDAARILRVLDELAVW